MVVRVRSAACLMAGFLALAGAAGCGGSGQLSDNEAPEGTAVPATSGDGASPGKLVVDAATAPASLDPTAVASLQDISLLSDLYVTLVKYATKPGPDGTLQEDPSKLVPYLAKSWRIGDGGRTYTFHLRDDAQFPDGSPPDARAVKFTFDRATKMGMTGAVFLNAGTGERNVRSVEVKNPTTLTVTLNRPAANFLEALTSPILGIVQPTLIEQHGGVVANQPNQWLASHRAGAGPSVLQSYTPGNRAVLAENPRFFGTKPRVPAVEVNFIAADETLLLRARSGAADVTLGMSGQSIRSLQDDANVRIVSTPAAQTLLVSIPNRFAPFDNVLVRRAMTYAVPYGELLDKVGYGYGSLYFGPYGPAFPEFDSSLEAPRAEDMAKAKQLMQQSGVRGAPLPVYIQQGAADQEKIATVLQNAWGELGIEVSIKQLAAAPYATALGSLDKRFSLVRLDGPSVPDAGWLLDYDAACESPYNSSNYCNPQVEELRAKASRTMDDDARQAIWDRIVRIWVSDAPRVPVYEQNFTSVLKRSIRHYTVAQEDFQFHLWGP